MTLGQGFLEKAMRYRQLSEDRSPVLWSRRERVVFVEYTLVEASWGGVTYRGPMPNEEDDAFLVSVLAGSRTKIRDGEGQWERAKRVGSIEIEMAVYDRRIAFVPLTYSIDENADVWEMRFTVNPYFSLVFGGRGTVTRFDDYFKDMDSHPAYFWNDRISQAVTVIREETCGKNRYKPRCAEKEEEKEEKPVPF